MELLWTVGKTEENYTVGIISMKTLHLEPIYECMSVYEAEKIMLLLRALIDPEKYYRSESLEPMDLIKELTINDAKGDRSDYARNIG